MSREELRALREDAEAQGGRLDDVDLERLFDLAEEKSKLVHALERILRCYANPDNWYEDTMRSFIDAVADVPYAVGSFVARGCEEIGEAVVAFLDREEGEIEASAWSERRDYLNYGPETWERYTEGMAPKPEERATESLEAFRVAAANIEEARRWAW